MYTIVELSNPSEIYDFLMENDIRLWVAYLRNPVYAPESSYWANYLVYEDDRSVEYGVYSFYVTRPFRYNEEDAEKLLELIAMHIPVVTFEEITFNEYVRIPSMNTRVSTRRVAGKATLDEYRKRLTVIIYDVDEKIAYTFSRRDLAKILKWPREYVDALLQKYPDTLTPPTRVGEYPKWYEKYLEEM